MKTVQTQRAFIAGVDQLIADEGHAYASGYLLTLATSMLDALPKRKQQEIIRQIESRNGAKMVEVVNLMTGERVMQRRDTPRSCDVSSELYWSM